MTYVYDLADWLEHRITALNRQLAGEEGPVGS
jgi:hypothetical protein